VTKSKGAAVAVKPTLLSGGNDAGADHVAVGSLDHKDRYFVQDDGPGLDGSPQEIARLFS